MITYWMPLIKAYKWDKELVINKEIVWKYKIDNDWTMNFKDVPKWVYLGVEELKKYNIPPFWRLDQKTWIWYPSKAKILDEEWNVEFLLK
jgi:hypothetical protein